MIRQLGKKSQIKRRNVIKKITALSRVCACIHVLTPHLYNTQYKPYMLMIHVFTVLNIPYSTMTCVSLPHSLTHSFPPLQTSLLPVRVPLPLLIRVAEKLYTDTVMLFWPEGERESEHSLNYCASLDTYFKTKFWDDVCFLLLFPAVVARQQAKTVAIYVPAWAMPNGTFISMLLTQSER